MIEDDALAHRDMPAVVNNAINKFYERNTFEDQPHASDNQPLFVKFYHPDQLISYIDLGRDRLPELFGFATVFGSFLCMIYINVTRTSLENINSIWVLCMVYFALLALLA